MRVGVDVRSRHGSRSGAVAVAIRVLHRFASGRISSPAVGRARVSPAGARRAVPTAFPAIRVPIPVPAPVVAVAIIVPVVPVASAPVSVIPPVIARITVVPAIVAVPAITITRFKAVSAVTIIATTTTGFVSVVIGDRPGLTLVFARRRRMRLLGGRIVDPKSPAVQSGTVQLVHSARGTVDIAHRDESETARSVSPLIIDNNNLFHLPKPPKLILQIPLGRADAQPKDAHDIVSIYLWRRPGRGRRRSPLISFIPIPTGPRSLRIRLHRHRLSRLHRLTIHCLPMRRIRLRRTIRRRRVCSDCTGSRERSRVRRSRRGVRWGCTAVWQ